MSDDAALFASDDYGETWTRFDAPFACKTQSGRLARADVRQSQRQQGGSSAAVTSVCGKPLTTARTGRGHFVPGRKGNYKQESNSIGTFWVTTRLQTERMYVGAAIQTSTQFQQKYRRRRKPDGAGGKRNSNVGIPARTFLRDGVVSGIFRQLRSEPVSHCRRSCAQIPRQASHASRLTWATVVVRWIRRHLGRCPEPGCRGGLHPGLVVGQR